MSNEWNCIGDLCEFRTKEAGGLIRHANGNTSEQESVQLALFDLELGSMKYLELLTALRREFDCVFFDEGWGNRVDFDDEFYLPDEQVDRPEYPKNAWES